MGSKWVSSPFQVQLRIQHPISKCRAPVRAGAMDFLRQLAADLHSLRAEAKRKYPVVKEAVDRALEALPALQQQYAALLRVEGRAPGPGHPLFQSESVLRPFLLACNHTNASHKILVLALASIQRLVSWDAIEPTSVGSILRVLQIQAEKNTHADVQVKLLQTLLQLMTLAYEEKKDTGQQDRTKKQSVVQDTGQQDSELVGNEDMVMQAVWICMHLHAASSSASSLVGNTAAMTIRQLVSLAFGKVDASPEAKHVGVLLFQELCFMSREENGVWLKRTAVSPMSAALGVELLETVLAAQYALFKDDVEFKAVLKQQMTPLVQSVLEMGCNDKNGGSANSGIMGPTNTSITSSNTNGAGGPFFPLLVRGMRLASTVLCHFANCLPGECALILHALLEIIATGTYTSPDTAKSPTTPLRSPDKFNPANAIANLNIAKEAKNFLSHSGWREVHAMKALFGAAHVMEEELSQIEWCILLEGFEIVVGLTDPKLKNGQQKLPTKTYRISAFRIEDEDVEQQLVMLSSSVVDFFRDALNLSSAALRKLLAYSIDEWTIVDSSDMSNPGSNHHMRIYQNYLGVGLTGSGSFMPCFALRMLTQLASSSKRCFEEVMRELVLMSTFVPQVPLTAAQFPQLGQFQLFVTENILQLMQNALQNIVNSLSPTANLKPSSIEGLDAASEEGLASPHVFNQQELFVPLLKLVRSDMKDRTLSGILELLNACGHLINSGWPLILAAVQEACEIGDGKTQVLAFKCLRLIVDDLIVSIPSSYLPDCVKCIGRFGCCAKDVNISLTAVNELWSVADVVGKQRSRQESDPSKRKGGQWGFLFGEFSTVALNDRAEVRNCAINTLFGTAVTYGAQFELTEWQLFMNSTVLPLAAKLGESQKEKTARSQGKKDESKPAGYMVHHSRDNAEKQWNESRVLVLTGISRVLEINWHYLLQHTSWFSSIWRELLNHVAVNAAFGMPKEVVLAAVKTLQTLLQVSSAGDFDHIAQSQPVRAGVGMRVVGGALVPSATPTSAATPSSVKRASSAPLYRDPVLWEEAFSQLLSLCDQRQLAAQKDKNPVLPWKEDEEQEIASAVVSVLVTLYMQAKEYEFKDVRNVDKMLDLFQALVSRHVLGTPAIGPGTVTKAITNITTNSLQSRVLNAFEECGSFASHPEVHTKMLDQLVGYVTQSITKDLVFFTRHALTSLAKLFASVSPEAREKRFLSPNGGRFPSCVQSEEDEVLVLSVLECVVDSTIALLGDGSEIKSHVGQQYNAFIGDLVALLCSGVDAVEHNKHIIRCCVRQLTTMCIQEADSELSAFARARLIACCNTALVRFAELDNAVQSKPRSPKPATEVLEKDSRLSSFSKMAELTGSDSQLLASHERLVVLLNSALEADMQPRSLMVMFPALCGCISSSNLEVRQLVQRLLLSGRLSEYCLELMDAQERYSR
ncbi:hypothetical protein BBJ29_005031 [Phytophthora kernoviae]|uniref:Uncharacterized protein n=1 Tax=Phytophthora kernoviae TaxID=325452 RepID=A0A3F2RRM7_9STRA|nr:hypothetical protein BBJ29_005031 [Phytophthora kernoviae]RLN62863.1 hypothetical protein BBP00_00004489 [Phytophthora kernoviae]